MTKEPILEIDRWGTRRYYMNGELHREDGPAVEWSNRDKVWYRNGQIHRENGPAIEYVDGSKAWYLNNHLHREDGPAIEYPNGTKQWYYQDQFIDCSSQEEFEKLIKLKAFW